MKIMSFFILNLALFFVVVPVPSYTDVIDRVVAIVNNDTILLSELKKATNQYKKSEKQIGELTSGNISSEHIESKVLNSLIDEKLIEHEIKHLGIAVTTKEVDAAIKHVEDLNGHYELSEILSYEGVSIEEFRENLHKQILKNKIIDKHVYSKIVISDDEIEKYYNDNHDLYELAPKYHICTILVNFTSNTKDKERKDIIAKMFAISQKLNSGSDFDQSTENFSIGNSDFIGYLGAFSKDELSHFVKKAIEGLTIGNSSKIIKTESKAQLFYIKDISKAEAKPLHMVKDKIYQKLLLKESKQELESWLNLLRINSIVEILNFSS